MSRSITRRGIAALTMALVGVAGTVACSSTTEVTDPTTTVQAGAPDELPSATSPPGTTGDEDEDDDDGPGTTRGDDDGPTGEETAQDYADALVASYDSSSSSDEVFSRDVVECVSPIWVDAIGVETFQDAGIAPADIADGTSDLDDLTLDRTAAEAIVDSLPECGLPLFDVFVDGLGSRVKEDPATVACIEGAVTESQIRAALVDQIRGEETSDPEDLVADCLI